MLWTNATQLALFLSNLTRSYLHNYVLIRSHSEVNTEQ